MTALPIGRAEVRRQGRSGLALIAVGAMVAPAQKIADRLDATLVNLRFIKPLDEDLVLQIAARHSAVVTLEENVVAGGAGSAIGELLASQDIQVSLLHIGIPDRFIEHGSRDDCLALAGLDAVSLAGTIEHWWARHSATRTRSVGGL
jgi:1-deoxy-D-xylulose-5-phosphate synthase